MNNLKNFVKNIKKNKIINTLIFVILFVLFFDKTFLLLTLGGIYLYNKFFNKKENYINSNISTFDNNLTMSDKLCDIFKNPKFNLDEYPNVEIKPGTLFLQNNKVLPECCNYYSQYSTDKGCPCITPEQQNYLKLRGTNKAGFEKNEKDYKNVFFSPTMAFKGYDFPFNSHDLVSKKEEPILSEEKLKLFKSLINLDQ